MKVLMLSWEYPPRIVGGLSRHVYGLSNALASLGIDVKVITCCSDIAPDEKNKNLEVYRVPSKIIDTPDFLSWIYFLNLNFIRKSIEIYERDNFDIIHAHDWLSAFAGYTLKHSLKKPLVSTIHATEYGRNQGIYTREQKFIHDIEWWLTYESWRVIVCSNSMKEEVKNLFSLPEDKIDIIPNGIDVKDLDSGDINLEEIRKKYAPNDEKIVLFIGRMYFQKGPEYLLRSIPIVLSKFPKTKFIFIGTGDMLEQLKREAYELGVQENTIFTGFIEDNLRNAILKVSDICVFPSIYEPFGIVALEAMALEKPVIASNTGGFSEIIESGRDGILFKPRDVSELSQKIIFLLENPDYAKELGRNAKEKVEKIYTWDKIAEKTLEVYNRVYKEYQNSNWK